jgi:hypothetical protein
MSRDRGNLTADYHEVECPYCGESVDLYVEPDVGGVLVQDCEVCCSPWLVRVHGRGGDRWISVARADGTD